LDEGRGTDRRKKDDRFAGKKEEKKTDGRQDDRLRLGRETKNGKKEERRREYGRRTKKTQ
jgi:hypothetical protein